MTKKRASRPAQKTRKRSSRATPRRLRARKPPARKPARKPSRAPQRRVVREAPAVSGRAAGFDTGSYPGDAAIRKWAADSPYRFVGFYLDAPCHSRATFRPWSGTFPVLKAAGLGLAVVYVGCQQDGCGKTSLSRATGATHGQDAVAKAAGEGFPSGTIVFLDVENYAGSLSPAMTAYLQGWIGAVLDSGAVKPGIYCPASKATDVRRAAVQEYAAHGLPDGAPAFWIVKASDPRFDPSTSAPGDSGVAFANVWQGRIDGRETHAGVTLAIDQNVADSRDPSGALQ